MNAGGGAGHFAIRLGVAAASGCMLAALACDPAQAGNARPDTSGAQSLGVVDSILPAGEALRRFQSDLLRVTELGGSASSRDALVQHFVRALENADTAALRRLHVSKAEYAFVYFPTSAYTRKPYELPPDIAWMLSEQNSAKGFTRISRRLGGKNLHFRGYDCAPAVTEGENRFWRSCHVSYVDPVTGHPVTKQLFGAMMQHGPGYKFLSYANDF